LFYTPFIERDWRVATGDFYLSCLPLRDTT